MPMWRVKNYTPFAAAKSWGRDKEGVHEWLVVVKGTFDIKPDGELSIASEQVEPLLAPEFRGDDGESSLRYEADLVAAKPATDILVNGTAYAPNGRPSEEFTVSLRVDRLVKTLEVYGNRSWRRGPLGFAEPVVEVPMIYERAFGGFDKTDNDPSKQQMDPRNPVGCGLAPEVGTPLPNFGYPGKSLKRAGPAGFGPLASYWSPRIELQGTYDEHWVKTRYPLPPADWDPRSLLCSPVDQQLGGHLRGGEVVELLNLTPGGVLRFALPKVAFTFRTRILKRVEEHASRVSTVIIEPDVPRVIMVWRTSLAVRADADYLEETVVRENFHA